MTINLTDVLKKAILEVADKFPYINEKLRFEDSDNILSLVDSAVSHGIPLEALLSEAAIIAVRENREDFNREVRRSISFKTAGRSVEELSYTENSSVAWHIDPQKIKECVETANETIELFHDLSLLYGVDLFQILGLRNLSSFVGEVFAKQVRLSEAERLISNPNQDGYPDLCALTPEGKAYVEEHKLSDGKIRRDKNLWSPYPFGGIEVKATCGNTPPAKKTAKPLIGESRLPIVKTAEWKAHHQETKILLGIFWDFVDGLPTVLAVFYRNDLDTTRGKTNEDWGALALPKSGDNDSEDGKQTKGGRTTSVSIMKKPGVEKMGKGWVVLPHSTQFLQPIARVFGVNLLSSVELVEG